MPEVAKVLVKEGSFCEPTTMCDGGLVLLGQQAMISKPTAVARVRVKSKTAAGNLPQERFFKKSKKLETSRGAKQQKDAFYKTNRYAVVQTKCDLTLPASKTQPANGIGKGVQPVLPSRAIRTKARSDGDSASGKAELKPRIENHIQAPRCSLEAGSKPVSPYASSSRVSRSFSAGSIRLHSRATVEDGGLSSRGELWKGRGRRRNMSGSKLSYSQRSFHAQVDIQIKETRSRGNTPLGSGLERRRLSSSSFGSSKQRERKERGLSTAEKKARQARMEEIILIQQQKAILRVEERKRHAVAQRQREEADQLERRKKARERYRLREEEQEKRRKHIYALNSIMREVESRCFEAFKEKMEKNNVSSEETLCTEDSSDSESISDCEDSEDSGETSIVLACKI